MSVLRTVSSRTERKWKCSEAPFMGSGVVRVLQAAQLHLRLQEAVLLSGHVLPQVGPATKKSRTRP